MCTPTSALYLSNIPQLGYYGTEWSLHAHVSWWRHQMETFSAVLAICAGNSPVTDEFPANNGEAGDLRRHNAHCDIIVMYLFLLVLSLFVPIFIYFCFILLWYLLEFYATNVTKWTRFVSTIRQCMNVTRLYLITIFYSAITSSLTIISKSVLNLQRAEWNM